MVSGTSHALQVSDNRGYHQIWKTDRDNRRKVSDGVLPNMGKDQDSDKRVGNYIRNKRVSQSIGKVLIAVVYLLHV